MNTIPLPLLDKDPLLSTVMVVGQEFSQTMVNGELSINGGTNVVPI